MMQCYLYKNQVIYENIICVDIFINNNLFSNELIFVDVGKNVLWMVCVQVTCLLSAKDPYSAVAPTLIIFGFIKITENHWFGGLSLLNLFLKIEYHLLRHY